MLRTSMLTSRPVCRTAVVGRWKHSQHVRHMWQNATTCSATARIPATTHHIKPQYIRHLSTTPSVQSPDDIAHQTLTTLAVDSVHNNFTVLSHTHVPELNMTLIKLQHTQSSTIWYHTCRADTNNAFCIGFRTPVQNSTGVAHILEHTVLCGSKRYNVRDPFFSLLRRSLNTYMNAMTAADMTMYPVASVNMQDLSNLVAVYCDSVFNPLLKHEAFLQEGHRLVLNDQPTNHTDDSGHTHQHSRLEHAGIVYNEMKGVMSDNSALFSYALQRELFADTGSAYVHNSGGEPPDITKLTHDELKRFHALHYNIDNCVFMSYGCHMPLLQLVDDNVVQSALKLKQQASTDSIKHHNDILTINDIKRWSSPRTATGKCPPDSIVADPNKQGKLSIAWLCQPFEGNGDAEWEAQLESFGLSLLTSLLLDGPNTPLYRELLETQLGSAYSPSTGYDSSVNQPSIAIGLQNIDPNDQHKITGKIDGVLRKFADTGFEQQHVDALLHQIELSLKHVTTHFGVGLVTRLIQSWAYKHNIEHSTRITDMINELRHRVQHDKYFQRLIQKHLLNNEHKLTYVMTPDEQYLSNQHHQEVEQLKQLESKLTDKDVQQITQDTEALTAWQKQTDDTSCLPGLTVSDIDTKVEPVKLEKLDIGQRNAPAVEYTVQPTNTMLYIRLAVDASSIPQHLIQYMPLYSAFVNDMSTKQLDYRQLSHSLELYTGGIGTSMSLIAGTASLTQYRQQIVFDGRCLQYNTEHLLDLMHQIVYEPVFSDTGRLHQLLYQTISASIQSLQESAAQYATVDACATLWPSLQQSEQLNGIPYIKFLHKLGSELSGDSAEIALNTVAERLQQLHQHIIDQGIQKILVNADQATLDKSKPLMESFIGKLSHKTNISGIIKPAGWNQRTHQQHYYALPLQVNNVSMAIPTVPYTHPDASKLDVMSKLASQLYIHAEVRERGGAYGGHASHNAIDGVLTMTSYRDPRASQTVDVFKQAGQWLTEKKSIGQTELDEAKLSLFSGIDAPKPPSTKGYTQWLYGIGDTERQAYRAALLNVSLNDVRDAADKYLVTSVKNGNYNVTIVGKQDNMDAGITNDKSWQVKQLNLNTEE